MEQMISDYCCCSSFHLRLDHHHFWPSLETWLLPGAWTCSGVWSCFDSHKKVISVSVVILKSKRESYDKKENHET